MNEKVQKTREKTRAKSKELIATLSQLESALNQWKSNSEVPTSEELKPQNTAPKIAEVLLKQLRQQIDELSD